MSEIIEIFTAETSRSDMRSHDAVQVKQGCGIVGDRYCRRTPTQTNQPPESSRAPINHITLLEKESVEHINATFNLALPAHALRRNLITSGVNLNVLVGEIFYVGDLTLRGVELSEPCSVIGRLLETPDIPARTFINALIGRGGLRAEVMSSGIIRVGNPVTVAVE